ncbi:MAG: UDP-N-acetylmuramate dehydrogenase [Clostridia bacterium]|nr:UDP-N-acetylmuramate dehydrogenase [Clostridia bacterium]
MLNAYIDLLKSKGIRYKEGASLALLSSFQIGGPADLIVWTENMDMLIYAIEQARRTGVKYCVIGNASNVLFSDEGFRGAIIFTHYCKNVTVDGTRITAECGASFTHLASVACKNALTGLEFAYGIPGSCGGAVFMNAGAYGGEVKDVLVSSTCYDLSRGAIRILSADEHKFDYRTSVYDQNRDLIVMDATFELKKGEESVIRATMDAMMASRRSKQPLEFPNAGSTFKRPEGHFAGKLIEDAGLKGYSIGGAQVSDKHAGFIVNKGGATAHDVLELIELSQELVMAKFGVPLECEIKYIE